MRAKPEDFIPKESEPSNWMDQNQAMGCHTFVWKLKPTEENEKWLLGSMLQVCDTAHSWVVAPPSETAFVFFSSCKRV